MGQAWGITRNGVRPSWKIILIETYEGLIQKVKQKLSWVPDPTFSICT